MTRHHSRTPHYPLAAGDAVERGLRRAGRAIRSEERARAAAERRAVGGREPVPKEAAVRPRRRTARPAP